MISDRSVFIDTNILVYANLALSPFHKQAVEKVEALNEEGFDLWISRQVLKEYLSAMTKQSNLTNTISISSLIADVQYFTRQFYLAEETSQVTATLLDLLEQVKVGGKQVHDANIVATMQVYRLTCILTHNVQDFLRFSEMITVLPLIESDR